MSDTLADLTSWLPSEFLSDDDMLLIDKENYFNTTTNLNRNALCFPTEFPYDFASPSSTESESEEEDNAGVTRRFSRSMSLQEPRKIPYDFEKRGFSGSPQSTLSWSVSGHSQVPSPPTPPLVKTEVDTLDLIYAAAGQVARMKMRMSMNNPNAAVGAPHSFAHHHPQCSIWGKLEKEELLFSRQQQFYQSRRVAGGAGGGRPLGLPQSAWPPLQVQNQQHHMHCNRSVTKPVFLGGSGGGAVAVPVKRECAGTGVFLPRRYCNNPPQSQRKPSCSPAHLPARVVQPNMDPIITQAQIKAQPIINGGSVPHYEMVIARRTAALSAGQQWRSNNTHGGVLEVPANNPEVLLPQEWTY